MSNKNYPIKVSLIAKLEWDHPLKQEIVEVEPPPGGSFIELPGPKRRPVRPYLEPFVSSSGIAARFIKADTTVMPVAVIVRQTSTVMQLPAPPLALNLRQDGELWVLNREELVLHDATGTVKQTRSLSGMTLVSATENAVWVVGLDNTWFVTGDGHVRGPYAWEGGLKSVGAIDSLCALEKRKPRRVKCLNPEGKEQFFTLASPPDFFEDLLAFKDNQAITMTASKLRRYGLGGVTSELVVQAAGLTASGDVFVSGRQNHQVVLYTSQDTPKKIPLPTDISDYGALTVVAVEGSRFLAHSHDKAIWYDGSRIEKSFTVDEKSYRNDIFPYLWSLEGASFVVASSEDTVIVSATGPTCLILISIQLQ
ncbi:hypothetical protein [Cylindrospermum stagnale]|nr:hypothetical protein [Cylindrospermum stagnale]